MDMGTLQFHVVWVWVPCSFMWYGYGYHAVSCGMGMGTMQFHVVWVWVPCSFMWYGYGYHALSCCMGMGTLQFHVYGYLEILISVHAVVERSRALVCAYSNNCYIVYHYGVPTCSLRPPM